jgi:hypothetical protein
MTKKANGTCASQAEVVSLDGNEKQIGWSKNRVTSGFESLAGLLAVIFKSKLRRLCPKRFVSDFSVQPLCSLWLTDSEQKLTTETQRTQRLHREEGSHDFLQSQVQQIGLYHTVQYPLQADDACETNWRVTIRSETEHMPTVTA